ncbi:MAG: hypothetical protein KA981_10300 [Bacteroidia bacterium]|nr:hypothetical protein [Bacteroidia bacterium]
MKYTTLLLIFSLSLTIAFAQPRQYFDLVKSADSLYKIKEYKNSAFKYCEAFKSNGWKGSAKDRYNSACAWSLANYPDSAFFQLERLATKTNFLQVNDLRNDTVFTLLHNDKRWTVLLSTIVAAKERADAKLNKPLVLKLDSIYNDDTKFRKQLSATEKEFGRNSKELESLWKIINEKDSINQIKVSGILEEYGWLGADVIGEQGNSALFLVIQHSNIQMQEKYIPMMREAVKDGRAIGGNLALLEDRIALQKGRRQIYGSQITRNKENQLYYVRPLMDPDNVDKRRAEVGLVPIAEYLERWNIIWNVEQYKKSLEAIEAYETLQKK